MSLSLAVIATQAGLIASAATTALLLDGIILTKNSGLAVAGGAVALEKAIEQRILNTIERTRNLAKVCIIHPTHMIRIEFLGSSRQG